MIVCKVIDMVRGSSSTERAGMTQLAQLLEDTREAKGLSRNKAAAMLGTSATTYRQWLRGQRPDLERFPMLAAWTGRSVADIVETVLNDDMGGYLPSLEPAAA